MDFQVAERDSPPIVVTGGNGTLGRLVVSRLLQAGQRVRIVSRNAAVGGLQAAGLEYAAADLESGNGLDRAVQASEIVLHLAGTMHGDDVKALNLLRALPRTRVKHLVYISVVGDDDIPVVNRVDRAMFGYFAAKAQAERAIVSSGIPSTIQHATQFYDLTFKTVAAMARLPIIPVPAGFRFQPIDAAEVADRLVELALGRPVGRAPDMGGPHVYEMSELVRSYMRAAGKQRLIVAMPLPGRAAAAIRAGANLSPGHALGRRTWEEFLAERLLAAGVGRADPRVT